MRNQKQLVRMSQMSVEDDVAKQPAVVAIGNARSRVAIHFQFAWVSS